MRFSFKYALLAVFIQILLFVAVFIIVDNAPGHDSVVGDFIFLYLYYPVYMLIEMWHQPKGEFGELLSGAF